MGAGPGRYRCEMGHEVRDMRGLTTDAELRWLGIGRDGTTGRALMKYTTLIANLASERAIEGYSSSYLSAQKFFDELHCYFSSLEPVEKNLGLHTFLPLQAHRGIANHCNILIRLYLRLSSIL